MAIFLGGEHLAAASRPSSYKTQQTIRSAKMDHVVHVVDALHELAGNAAVSPQFSPSLAGRLTKQMERTSDPCGWKAGLKIECGGSHAVECSSLMPCMQRCAMYLCLSIGTGLLQDSPPLGHKLPA